MAQGFLKSTSRNEELEMIGDDYLNNLAMRSFFQDFYKDDNGNIIYCQMHDLVHDFAQFLTKNECSSTLNSYAQFLNSNSKIRHLTLVCVPEEMARPTDSYDYFTSLIDNSKKLRTLQIMSGCNLRRIKEVLADLFCHLRCLKVLCLNHIGLENLSSEIGNLINLRYLDLSWNLQLKILPETISKLYNLQTLKLDCCSSLCELPREMWRMINLRHLDISETYQLNHIPQGIGRLTSLRTLSDFIVGGASEGCKIGELKDLNLLQGDLSIRGLGRVETVNEAFEMEIKKKKIHSLMLDFRPNEETEENGLEQNLLAKRMEDVLEVLEPHSEVVEIGVLDYLGFKLSRWIGSTSILSHMKTLNLYHCINLTKFPALGQLPSLEVLNIEMASKVKHIGLEFYTNNLEHGNMVAFPKLKKLYMEKMDNLEEWELKRGVVMPSLISIRILGCPKLKALPALGKLQSLEELTIHEADELRHIGPEFLYEVDEAGGELFNNVAFQKLKTLALIMPSLRELDIPGFKNCNPIVEISSLKSFTIRGEATEFIKNIRVHDDLHIASEIIFPNLIELSLFSMEEMEELKIGSQVMPLLNSLHIYNCNKLKAIQGFSELDSLQLTQCASLYELPFPNLRKLWLNEGIHPSLTEAFATLQTLEVLSIVCWPTLTCMPEQIQQLTRLQKLELLYCGDDFKQRCRKDEGEDWRIISHIPNIDIDYECVISNFNVPSERE